MYVESIGRKIQSFINLNISKVEIRSCCKAGKRLTDCGSYRNRHSGGGDRGNHRAVKMDLMISRVLKPNEAITNCNSYQFTFTADCTLQFVEILSVLFELFKSRKRCCCCCCCCCIIVLKFFLAQTVVFFVHLVSDQG